MNNNLISILYLYALFMVTIPTVTTTGFLNSAIAINDNEDINCAFRAQCCYLKIIGKDDPCDKLLIKPDDGLDVRQTN
jgi:hypothetical protein